MANTLIGSSPADTLNNVGSVLALLEVSADHLATQALCEEAATGLTLILGLLGGAVASARDAIPG